MITVAALVLLAATPPPTPTPAPTPPVRVLLRGQSESAPTSGGGSLADVAKRIKLKLPKDQPRKLDNASVEELSRGVQLTTAAPVDNVSAGGPAVGSTADPNQTYWQQRYQEARAQVAFWEAEALRLDGERARLENQFYAMDDPAYRDGVVKPAWDKAIADLRAARASLEAARRGPDEVLEEARKAGALPGWFRGLPDPTPPASGETAPDA